MANGFRLYDFRTQKLEHLVELEAGTDTRFNDR
jgi:hypothetical protein